MECVFLLRIDIRMVDGSDAGGHRFKCPHCVLAVSSVDYDGVKGHGKIEHIGRFR